MNAFEKQCLYIETYSFGQQEIRIHVDLQTPQNDM